MAFGMKHWIGLTAAGIAVALVYLYPPRSANEVNAMFVRERPVAPASDRLVAMESEALALRTRLQRVRWADSLKALMHRASQEGRGSVLGMPYFVGGSYADSLQRRFDRQLEAAGGVHPDVRVGTFVVDYDSGLTQDTDGRVSSLGWEHYAGTLPDGQPYCYTLVPATSASHLGVYLRHGFEGSPPLGVCRFWARYGAPGEHLDDWLRNGALAFGSESHGSESLFVDYWMEFANEVRDGPGLARAFDGGWAEYIEYMDLRAEACLRSDLDACRALILEPAGETRLPVARSRRTTALERDLTETTDFVTSANTVTRRVTGSFPAPVGVLFVDLQEEFGDEAMEKFWTSSTSVPEAFQAAFGVELGSWVHGWLTGYITPSTRGPRLQFGTMGLSLLLVGAVFAIAFYSHQRRQVA